MSAAKSLPPALDLAIELIRRESLTPNDGGCQDWLEDFLEPLGFTRMHLDRGGVTNSIYIRPGERKGVLAFAGHTDVVPPGPAEQWPYPPFAAVVEDTSNGKLLHGRGAQDMKGGIACWLAAVRQLIEEGHPLPGLQMLITSDEEGASVDGTVRIVEWQQAHHSLPDAAIVGEPSSAKDVGDVVRRGRRGVVQARIIVRGKQGHSAYPDEANNAAHLAIPLMDRIVHIDWGKPADGFPPTTCQITNVRAGTGAMNVIPGVCEIDLDIRYNPGIDFPAIERHLFKACEGVDASLSIEHQAEAFKTPDGPFLDLVCDSVRRITGRALRLDTGGGTSDGRFLAAAGVPVAELGLTNSTIHQVGECVAVEELAVLTAIYADIIKRFEV